MIHKSTDAATARTADGVTRQSADDVANTLIDDVTQKVAKPNGQRSCWRKRKLVLAGIVVSFLFLLLAVAVLIVRERNGREEMLSNPIERFEFNDGRFSVTYEKEGDNICRIVAITNMTTDVTSVDLRRFGKKIFENLVSGQLEKGGSLTPEDESILYFVMDIWVDAMNDVIMFVTNNMSSPPDCTGVPDDFEEGGARFDVKQLSLTDSKRIMTARPREALRRIRSVCVTNMDKCDAGQIIVEFGKDFWAIPREVFLYQLNAVQGKLRHHKEKCYIKPGFGNFGGLLRTDDHELSTYVVSNDVVRARMAVDRELVQAFSEMDAMVVRVREALASTGDKKSRDILHEAQEEFGHKNEELKSNFDLIVVDIPVVIYAKIALNEIDKAKGLNDSEKDMIVALKKFHERTENGRLIARVKSESALDVYGQLIAKARDELGDGEVEKIFGMVW